LLDNRVHFVRILKHQLVVHKHFENLKESLFSVEGFSLVDLFKAISDKEKGLIALEDLQKYADEVLQLQIDERILNLFDLDNDGKINYNEFARALTPKDPHYQAAKGRGRYGLSQKELELREKSLNDELVRVFEHANNQELELSHMRNALQVDVEAVFAEVDQFKLGYISLSMVRLLALTLLVEQVREGDAWVPLDRQGRAGADGSLRQGQRLQDQQGGVRGPGSGPGGESLIIIKLLMESHRARTPRLERPFSRTSTLKKRFGMTPSIEDVLRHTAEVGSTRNDLFKLRKSEERTHYR